MRIALRHSCFCLACRRVLDETVDSFVEPCRHELAMHLAATQGLARNFFPGRQSCLTDIARALWRAMSWRGRDRPCQHCGNSVLTNHKCLLFFTAVQLENVSPAVMQRVARDVKKLMSAELEGIKVELNEHDFTDIQAVIDGPGKRTTSHAPRQRVDSKICALTTAVDVLESPRMPTHVPSLPHFPSVQTRCW